MSKRPTTFINSLKIGELYNAIRHQNMEAVHRLAPVVDLTAHGNSVLRFALASKNIQIIECVFPKAAWLNDGEILILAAATNEQCVYNLVHACGDYDNAVHLLEHPPFGSDWQSKTSELKIALEQMETQFLRERLAESVNEHTFVARRKSKM